MRHEGSLFGRASGKRNDVELRLEPDPHQSAPGLAGITVETASGTSISLDRGPGGLAARRRTRDGPRSPGRCWEPRAARPGSSVKAFARRCCATTPTPGAGGGRGDAGVTDGRDGYPGHSGAWRIRQLAGRRARSSRRSPSTRFLSDCETCALVAPSGNVEWLCLPRFDSPSIFGAILDRDAGGFRVGPADVDVPADRRYLPGHDGARDQLGHPGRLDHRARRTADGAMAPRGRPLEQPSALAHRLRLRPRAAPPRALRERRGAGAPRLRAGIRLRALRRDLGVRRAGLPQRRGHRRRDGDIEAAR